MAIFKFDNTAGDGAKLLPRHIAIILDGNGRWAKRRGLPRTAGHAAGAETFRRIATYCKDIGIDYLTVYAFSTENWKRPREEVDAIMGLLGKYLREAVDTMERDNIRRDAMDSFKTQKKNGDMTEDDVKIAEKDFQKITDDWIKEIDKIADKKEKELFEI